MNNLSVIIPAYNEEEGIAETLNELIPVAQKNNWSIIVVNDGSSDKTLEILKLFADKIVLVNHPYNKGYGAALKSGIKKAQTEYIAFYDADGQHRVEDLEVLFKESENYDMVVGERGKTSYQDWMRKPGKWALSKVANYLTEREIPDLNSGLRIIRKSIIKNLLHLFPNGFSFSTTSTIAFFNLGYSVSYFPVKTKKRVGKSTVKQLKHGTDTVLLIIRLILLFNPLKVFFPTSTILFFVGLIYEIIFGIILLPGGVRLIPAAFFLMLTSVLIFFFGLVVDQVSELRKHINLIED